MSERIDAEAFAFGQRLQQFREQAKVTQQEIADASGMTKNYISSIERGVHKCNAATFIVYAKKSGISLDELAGLPFSDKMILPELRRILSTMDEKQQQDVIDMIKVMHSFKEK